MYQIVTDSPICFPGLFGDWCFTASSKALNIGHGIYWYGIIITCGLLTAVLVCMRLKEKYGITEDNLMDCLLFGIPGGIIGARLYYVVFYLDLYKNSDGSLRIKDMLAIWDGGLAIYGGVIATAIVIVCVAKKEKFNIFAMTDLVCIGFFIGQAVGRWGNFMNREAFGCETTLPWRMQLITKYGTEICVHPTFLYESIWNCVGLILILTIVSKARRFDGENTCFYLFWYGLGRLWIEGLRTDSLYLFNLTVFGSRIRVSQFVSFLIIVVSAVVLISKIKKGHSKPLYVDQVNSAKDKTATSEE